MGHVALDRGLADDQLGGDLGIRQAPGDQLQDLPLAVGQPGQRIAFTGRRKAGELLDDPAGDRGGEQGVAGGDHPHR